MKNPLLPFSFALVVSLSVSLGAALGCSEAKEAKAKETPV